VLAGLNDLGTASSKAMPVEDAEIWFLRGEVASALWRVRACADMNTCNEVRALSGKVANGRTGLTRSTGDCQLPAGVQNDARRSGTSALRGRFRGRTTAPAEPTIERRSVEPLCRPSAVRVAI
jgi:hypothetical protein